MSRSILFAGALLAFCTLGYTYTFSALLPIYVQTFGATASQVSWIGTLNTAILGMASVLVKKVIVRLCPMIQSVIQYESYLIGPNSSRVIAYKLIFTRDKDYFYV
jgi:hypothetical protein